MSLLDRLRAWTYRRQLLDTPAPTPLAALRHVVGVYSSHPTAPLALLVRSRVFEPADLPELELRRHALRLPGMRGSIFLLPAETAPRVYAAHRLPPEKHDWRLEVGNLTRDEYARLKAIVQNHAREPKTTAELQREIAADGRLMTAVRTMAMEGAVLRVGGSLRSDNLRYVATDAWLGGPLPNADLIGALEWLAAEYLRAYGPARVEDFAWWTGATKRRAAAALDAHETVDIGAGLRLTAADVPGFERVEPLDPDAVVALPKWDAYTMGYAGDGRRRLLDDDHRRLAYTRVGDGLPLLLRGGRAVAAWGHRFAGNRLTITVAPFAPGIIDRSLYEPAFEPIGRLLGASSVDVTEGTLGSATLMAADTQ